VTKLANRRNSIPGPYPFYHGQRAMPLLRQLVARFPWWTKFDPKPVHAECVADKVEMGWVFSTYFDFTFQFIFHHLPHTYLSPYQWHYNSFDSDSIIK
jgi:hypothetical protein